MLDRNLIGHAFTPHAVNVTTEMIVAFARSIEEGNPVFTDPAAARAAGYASLPAPPTYGFCLEMIGASDPFEWAAFLGINLDRVLHGEQSFRYHAPILAGARVTFTTRIADIYERRNGALEFVVLDTAATDGGGEPLVDMQRVVVVRN